MAKRLGDPFTNNNMSKRKKMDNPDETLWDDDLDDNCFDEIANKIFEKDDIVQATQENSSILLSYDSFKPNIPFASTQDITPTTNYDFKRPQSMFANEDINMKVTYLQQKFEAKEGEVSILRAQMKKIKSDMLEDQSKKQREYLETTNLKEKEIKSIKGQLDFKDLEIANLKQKISEISKANLSTSTCHEFSKRQRIDSSSKGAITYNKESTLKISKEAENDFVTSILMEPEYIVYSKGVSELFESSTPEIHVVETRGNQYGRNTIPYLHNQMVQEESTIPPGPKLTAEIDGRDVALENIYAEVFALFQFKSFQDNTEDRKNVINKLLGISIQLLKNFIQYLDQLENIYRTEDIEQLDRVYLQKNSKECDIESEKSYNNNCEIGIRAGRTIQVVAELLPYNDYLKELLLSNQGLNENILSHDYLKDLKKKDFYFLLLNDIVRKIFTLRKSEVCTTFLQSVASLLLAVSKENLYHNIFSAYTSLIASVLYTRPSPDVIYKLLVIMRNCSRSKNFLDFLCEKPDCKKFTIDKKRKLNYFSEDSCKFTIFVSLLKNALQDTREEELSLDVTFHVLSFVDNIFTSNPYWVHDQQKDRCICLEQLYQLVIEVLYLTLLKFQKNKNNSHKDKYISVFKCGIRVFELLFFNSCYLIEKCIDSYSRYKGICQYLLELKEDLDLADETYNLEKLCLFEEVQNVPSSCFELI